MNHEHAGHAQRRAHEDGCSERRNRPTAVAAWPGACTNTVDDCAIVRRPTSVCASFDPGNRAAAATPIQSKRRRDCVIGSCELHRCERRIGNAPLRNRSDPRRAREYAGSVVCKRVPVVALAVCRRRGHCHWYRRRGGGGGGGSVATPLHCRRRAQSLREPQWSRWQARRRRRHTTVATVTPTSTVLCCAGALVGVEWARAVTLGSVAWPPQEQTQSRKSDPMFKSLHIVPVLQVLLQPRKGCPLPLLLTLPGPAATHTHTGRQLSIDNTSAVWGLVVLSPAEVVCTHAA